MALLNSAREAAITDIETFIKLAQEQLEERQNELRNEILDVFDTKQTALYDKQNEIQKIIKLINGNITQAINTTQSGDVSKLKSICNSLKNANEETRSVLSHLNLGEDYWVFDSNKAFSKLTEYLRTLDQPYIRGFLPTMFKLDALEAKVGRKTDLPVEAYNVHGDKVPVPFDAFSLQITDPTDTELHTQLCAIGSDCAVTFRPKVSGLHHVCGFFLGEKLISEQTHISVSSNNHVLKFGGRGNGRGTFKFPSCIAIDNNGILYVADCGNRLIQKFSANGEFLSQLKVKKNDKDCYGVNMALDLNNGLMYCIYSMLVDHNCRVGKMLTFNLDGELQRKQNLSGVADPVSIAINSHGDLFIADRDKKCLIKLDKYGNNLQCIRDFKNLNDVAIAIADNDIIIVSNSCSIIVLNPDGSARHGFRPKCPGKLNRPKGVATDGENILVADSENNLIQIYGFDGTFASVIAGGDDPLSRPQGLAVTKDGFVYVTDGSNHCIKKYKYRDVT